MTEDTEVAAFLAALTNRAAYDQAAVLKAYTTAQKQDTDKLENDDKLFLKKGEEEATYKLQVESGGMIVVPGGLSGRMVLNSRLLRQELLAIHQ